MESKLVTKNEIFEPMVKAGMHFGRKKSVFNPNMSPFVFGVKEQIHILDLTKTLESLEKVANRIKQLVSEGKVILFVGVTKQSSDSVRDLAIAFKMPYVSNRWLGGLLTNFKTIISRVNHLEELERLQRDGLFDKYTKKERVVVDREITALKSKFDGLRSLKKLPDVVFVSSLKEGKLPVKEASMSGIETIAIVNTDSNPKDVTLAIPANDTSKKSIEFILDYIQKNA